MRQAVPTIAFRDICLFCTVRSQFAAVRRASLQVQKRRFQSESRAPKQSTEAVSRDHYELTNLEEQSETVQTDIRQNVSDSRELLDEFLNTSKPFREPISRSVQWRNVYGQEDNGDDERCASCHIDGPSKKDASNFPRGNGRYVRYRTRHSTTHLFQYYLQPFMSGVPTQQQSHLSKRLGNHSIRYEQTRDLCLGFLKPQKRQLLATYHTFSTPKLDHSVIGLKFSTRRFYSNARPVNPKLDLPLDSSRNGDPSRKAFLENEPAMRHVQLAATKPRRAIEAPISPKNSDLSSEERLARWPAQRSREPDVRQDIRDNPRLVSSQPSLREQDRPSFSGLPRERGKRESSGYISWTEALKPASRDQGQMWTSQQPRERAGQQRHRDAFWPDTSKSLQNGRNQEQVSQHPRRHAVQHGSAQKRLNNQRSDLGPKVEAFDRDGNGEYFSETLSFGMEDSDLEAERSNPIIQRKRLRNWREDVGNISRFSRHRPPESESYRFGRSRKSRFAKDHESDMEDYDEERQEARERRKAQRKKEKEAQARSSPPTPIYLPEFISVSNLAKILKVRVEAFAKKLKELGFEETNTDHVLEAEVAGLIAAEFNFEPIVEKMEDLDLQPRPPAENKSLVPQRPPIVTIMGHVDHGKTTLLDYLRKSSVAASEHGGITQHIGAFSVCMPEGRLVTFLDTPGHEAFLSMRQRGANVTDIVILVVAADDSVKPQTVEAIKHAQAAKVPMIAAINKIDKEDSNIERVKQDLARYGVEIEDFGGDTQVVCVSGKTGQGLDELEDAIVALADIIDMRAETDGQAEGWVLEATTKKAGRVATVLVRRGTIKAGDVIVAGSTWSRIRSLKNEAGLEVSEAGPGTPVEVDGWRGQPFAGDQVLQANSEHQAKSVVEFRVKRAEKAQLTLDMNAMNEARRTDQEKQEAQETNASQNNADALKDTSEQQQRDQGEQKNQGAPLVNLLIKADVSGSIEAVTKILSTLSSPQVSASVLRATVGPVNESDVVLAAAAPAHIISFNQDIEGHIRRMAESQGVQILEERIIYRLADKVKEVLENMLPAIVTKRVLGEAEISQVFEINARGRKVVLIAGCRVRNGSVGRGMKISVMRGEGREVVYDGSLSSLKNHKKDVQEMGKGTECGMGFEKWSEFQVGDLVQAYEEKSERRRL